MIKRTSLTLFLLLLFAGGVWGEAVCKELIPKGKSFGSSEQLIKIQRFITNNQCNLISIYWENQDYLGLTIERTITVDVEKGIMGRTASEVGSKPRYEMWQGFTKEQLLNDDPDDGIDLPNYKTQSEFTKDDVQMYVSMIKKINLLLN